MKRLFLLLIVFLFFGCKNYNEKTTPIIQDISESVYASGNIKSNNQYQVMSTVNGIISELFVKAGDSVKKDQEILSISNIPSRLLKENAELAAIYADFDANKGKLDELRIAADLAKTKLSNDSAMLIRQQKLWADNIGTKIELEQRELMFKTSKNNYQTALLKLDDLKRQLKLNAQQAENNLKINSKQESDFIIKSDIDGRLYELYKEKGELVSPQNIIGIIGSAIDFYAEIQIDESDIMKIKPGQKVLLTIESNKEEVYEAHITRVIPYMNEKTKTFTAEATFDKKPETLYPNTTLEANVIINTKAKCLLIPRKFLMDGDSVVLADGKKIKIATGLKDYRNVEVISGLTETQEIIIPKK